MSTDVSTVTLAATAAKKAHDEARAAGTAPIAAWHDALVALKLVTVPPIRHRPGAPPLPPAPPPAAPTVTTADLPALANAKLSAEHTIATTGAAHAAAQAALKQALKDAGAQ